MRLRNFRGGIHPLRAKELTYARPVADLPLPAQVVIPLSQHLGAPNEPLVAVGDRVYLGQKIGDTKAFVAAPVHASVSGRVVAIEPRPVAVGTRSLSVVIERDGDELLPGVGPVGGAASLAPGALREAMRAAGLIGMGGAGFPTHVKYSPPAGKRIETVILNAAECEPCLTCDHQLLRERPDLAVEGLLAMMRAGDAKQGFIGIEDDKTDVTAALEAEIKRTNAPVEVAILPVKYPQGEERMLIRAIVGREVPSGGLPVDVGVIVNNVATASALAEYLRTGIPLIQRILTVTGSVAEPQNVRARLGVSLAEIVAFCGGPAEEPRRIIYGGPMTGLAGYRLDVPLTKTMSGLLIQGRSQIQADKPMACVRCGRCLEVCPYGLVPSFLATYGELAQYDKAAAIGLLDCRECGSCTYVCPSRRPLLQTIKEAKSVVAKKQAAAQETAASGGPRATAEDRGRIAQGG